ncbi:hypothetical protein ACQBAU_00865 [Propionibacteriaceae bacterium Y2011]
MTDRPTRVAVVPNQRRARCQLVGFGVALLLMLGTLGLGVWIAVGAAQLSAGSGGWVAVGLGVVIGLVGLAATISAVEVLRQVGAGLTGDPVFVVDDTGFHGRKGLTTPWSEVTGIRVVDDGAAPRARHQHTKSFLDRTAGTGLGMRDGTRRVRVSRAAGHDHTYDLTLAVAPHDFAPVAEAVRAHARSRGVPCTGS